MASSSKGLQLIWQDERQSRTSNQPPLIQMRCAIPSAGGSTLRVSEGESEGEGEGEEVDLVRENVRVLGYPILNHIPNHIPNHNS